MTAPPRIAAALAGLLLAGALAGCSSGADPAPPPVPAWSEVRLPAGFVPAYVVAGPDDSVLVAADGAANGRRPPRLLQVRQGDVSPVPISIATYYGRRVVWHGLTTAGSQLFGFGGRSGGAHGNIRWTAWSGDLGGSSDAVHEDPQDFETFGGPRGGALSGVAVQPDGSPVLIGSRVSDSGVGLDVVAWGFDGGRWEQRSSAGTSLAASNDQQPAAHAVARRDGGLLVVGSATTFGAHPRTGPAVWSAPDLDGPWTQTQLSADDVVAEAESVACGADGDCLVAGYDGDRLAAWDVPAAGEPSRVQLPQMEAGRSTLLAEGAGAVVLASADADGEVAQDGRLLIRVDGTWTDVAGPASPATALAVADHVMWVVADGRLWSAPARS